MEDISNLESKVSDEYDGSTRVLYKLECQHCSNAFWRPAKDLGRSKFCKRDCYTEARAKVGKRITLECLQCQKPFKKFQHHAAQVKSGRYFCSRACQQQSTIIHRVDCLSCKKEVIGKGRVYCSSECQWTHTYDENIRKWKSGEIEGINAAEGLRSWLRRYLLDKADNQCSECGWCKVNPTTGKIPLQIDHVDGNYKNNTEENLRVLCPCCHSLTPTYGALNIGNGREKRRKKLQGNGNLSID